MARRRVPPQLDVWLYGHRVATLSEPRPLRYRLEYTPEALDQWGEGARILSLALPFARTPTQDRDGFRRPVGAFLEGLLPEGPLLGTLATQAGVSRTDLIHLLEVVGRECAGAVQFLPHDERPNSGTVRPLTADEVAEIVSDLPTYHLPDGVHVQASLAGIQDKILLVEQQHGWGWPEHGAASTHLIKPEPLHHQIGNLIQGEDWALRVAGAAGIPAAEARLAYFGRRAALIVKRYDRDAAGLRVHQEDFTQALGLDPSAKYEPTNEGNRLRRLVALAAPRAADPSALRRSLLSAVTFNVLLGNSDAHSKNYSLLIDQRGAVSLAPLYDTAPVMFLDNRFVTTGHVINGRTRIAYVTRDDLVAEATTWGLSRIDAERTVRDDVDRVVSALTQVPAAGDLLPVRTQLDRFWKRRAWLTGGAVPTDVSSHGRDGGHSPRDANHGPAANRHRQWVRPYVTAHGTTVGGYWRTHR